LLALIVGIVVSVATVLLLLLLVVVVLLLVLLLVLLNRRGGVAIWGVHTHATSIMGMSCPAILCVLALVLRVGGGAVVVLLLRVGRERSRVMTAVLRLYILADRAWRILRTVVSVLWWLWLVILRIPILLRGATAVLWVLLVTAVLRRSRSTILWISVLTRRWRAIPPLALPTNIPLLVTTLASILGAVILPPTSPTSSTAATIIHGITATPTPTATATATTIVTCAACAARRG
jgi:hypothetical protein